MGVQIPLPPLLGIASVVVYPRNQGVSCTGGAWHGVLQCPQDLGVHRVEVILAMARLRGLCPRVVQAVDRTNRARHAGRAIVFGPEEAGAPVGKDQGSVCPFVAHHRRTSEG